MPLFVGGVSASVKRKQKDILLLRIHNPEIQTLLQIIPGLGPVTSATLIAEIIDIHRFLSPKHFTTFIGIDPRTYNSGTSIHGKGYNTKRGNTIFFLARGASI